MSDETTKPEDDQHLSYEQVMGIIAAAEQIAISAIVLATNSSTFNAPAEIRPDALNGYLEMIRTNSTAAIKDWPEGVAAIAMERLNGALRVVASGVKGAIEAQQRNASQQQESSGPEQPAQNHQQVRPIPMNAEQAIGRQLATEQLLLQTMFLAFDRATIGLPLEDRREKTRQYMNYLDHTISDELRKNYPANFAEPGVSHKDEMLTTLAINFREYFDMLERAQQEDEGGSTPPFPFLDRKGPGPDDKIN